MIVRVNSGAKSRAVRILNTRFALACSGVLVVLATLATVAFGARFTGRAPRAASDDPVASLIKQQTDAFADASARGNQAIVDGYLDDQVLFSGGNGTVDRDPKLDKEDAVSALLKQQAQAFLDAGRLGDMAAMRSYLDDQVLFVNEEGGVSGLSDFKRAAPEFPPPAIPSSIKVTDWVLHYSGDVAVSSFIDDQDIHFPGQDMNFKFLAVETWIKRGEAWKLIGSQTIPLHEDPPAMNLAPGNPNDYVGTYRAGPNFSGSISGHGETLSLSTNGGKPTPLRAVARDVFFVAGLPPGYPRTHIAFRRDAGGRITGYVSRRGLVFTKDTGVAAAINSAHPNFSSPLNLQDFVVHVSGDVAVATFIHQRFSYYGQIVEMKYRSTETWIKRANDWKMIASQGREILPDPLPVTLSANELNDYAGEYGIGPSPVVTISKDGDHLAISIGGGEASPLLAEARDVFFIPGQIDRSIIFRRDAAGHVTSCVNRRDDRDLVFTKS